MARKFMRENGLKHVSFSTADGALEAAPAVRLFLCRLNVFDIVMLSLPEHSA